MQDLTPILRKADDFFMGRSEVHGAARAIARLLEGEGMPYAIADALALAVHGRPRLTDDVDILIRQDDLSAFKERWLGRGYVEVTKGLKAVRDTARGVKLDFLVMGDFPGDGKPKPVAFPDPATQSSTGDGFRVVDLNTLLELKLASGMTAPHRARDIADVIDLIRARSLPLDQGQFLHEYVRNKFDELWHLGEVARRDGRLLQSA
jgi:hypothetical protein